MKPNAATGNALRRPNGPISNLANMVRIFLDFHWEKPAQLRLLCTSAFQSTPCLPSSLSPLNAQTAAHKPETMEMFSGGTIDIYIIAAEDTLADEPHDSPMQEIRLRGFCRNTCLRRNSCDRVSFHCC